MASVPDSGGYRCRLFAFPRAQRDQCKSRRYTQAANNHGGDITKQLVPAPIMAAARLNKNIQIL
jgi:hypothetical protein